MNQYCRNCGSPLDEETGLCPECDYDSFYHETENDYDESYQETELDYNDSYQEYDEEYDYYLDNHEPNVKSKKEFFLKLIITLLAVFIASTITFLVLVYFDVLKNETINGYFISLKMKSEEIEQQTTASDAQHRNSNVKYDAPSFDVDSYFEENSEIVNKINAKKSNDNVTEAEAYKMFTSKGFNQAPITWEYSIDGNSSGEKTVNKSSSKKRPMYSTYFSTKKKKIWNISLINGRFIAIPISANATDVENQIVLSEKDTVMSYDANSNMFYETYPDISVYEVRTVKNIDANTINSDEFEEVD